MTNPVIESLLNHRSVRKYLPQPVESEKVELILKAGTRAATGGNLQLYSFVVIDDPAMKEKLDRDYPQMEFKYADIPLVIIALADLYRVRRWFEVFGVPRDRISNNRIFNLLMANWDALIALQNMVVAAESMDLGTCYVGNALLMDVGTLLGAPENVFPAGLITVGYPDGLPDLSSRLPMEAVVHKNGYHPSEDDEIKEIYRERNEAWDRVPDDVKERLAHKGIHNIPEGVARRKFGAEDYFVNEKIGSTLGISNASRIILENLGKAGFDLTDRA